MSNQHTLIDDRFDVNSEGYFNEKLHLWLKALPPSDIVTVLNSCLSISGVESGSLPRIYPWDSYDPQLTAYGRFDQKIDVGIDLCVILELKVGTEASVGQLKKYLDYIPAAGYKRGFVVLLSRNAEARSKLGYDQLMEHHPNLLFTTWGLLETNLRTLIEQKSLKSPRKLTEDLVGLISFLTDINKRSERLIDQPPPAAFDVDAHVSSLVPAPKPKKRDVVLQWHSRLQFWNEVLDATVKQVQTDSFCAFRFDLYEWIMRWAFHCKQVVFDIYEDKNYEYLYRYFFSTIYPNSQGLPAAQYSDLYYRILLVRDDKEFLETEHHRIFFKKSGKRVYFYALSKEHSGNFVPYLQLFKFHFSF